MITHYSNVKIAGICAAVPAYRETVADLLQTAPRNAAFIVKRVADLAGLREHYIAPPEMTAAHLAAAAGRTLLRNLGWDAKSVDLLFFVTQTPDYLLPGTAYALHHALQMSSDCVATDVTAACSGLIQGIWLAGGHLERHGAQRALVIVGDASSKWFSPSDWGNRVLFGDGVGAAALEYTDAPDAMTCLLESFPDMTKALTLYGCGYKKTPEDPAGFVMDGTQIIKFTRSRVPEAVVKMLRHIGKDCTDIDAFFFHQPNEAILKGLVAKLHIAPEKMPLSISQYGNCGSASIAITMCHSAASFASGPLDAVLCGFGGGLAVAVLNAKVDPATFFPIISTALEDSTV